jgi:hypothetical protein
MPRRKQLVNDVDKGFAKRVSNIQALDGLEIRSGWLTGGPKYPKRYDWRDPKLGPRKVIRKRKPFPPVAVAKVAGIHIKITAMSMVVDSNSQRIFTKKKAAVDLARAGLSAESPLRDLTKFMLEATKALVREKKLIRRGVLMSKITSEMRERFTKQVWSRRLAERYDTLGIDPWVTVKRQRKVIRFVA